MWSIGVHGCDGTHWLPHPEQANTGSPARSPRVRAQAHRDRHGEITSGRGTVPG